jgi:molybdate transport system substrate-binding protein
MATEGFFDGLLGSGDESRTHVVSIVTVLRSMLVICSVFGLACHDSDASVAVDCDDRPVRMGVASSLREIAVLLGQDSLTRDESFEFEMIFGASSALARQLSLGAPMDILVSADAEIVSDLVDRNLLAADSAVEFARGRLALVARADWPALNAGLDALDDSSLHRVAIPSMAVPLGRYARHWLEARGQIDRLKGRIVTTEHARATLSAVDSGHVDLAIVYESDTRLARRAVVLATIKSSEHPPIRYVAARAIAAPPCTSIDTALSAWTLPSTSTRLISLGFLPPAGKEDL